MVVTVLFLSNGASSYDVFIAAYAPVAFYFAFSTSGSRFDNLFIALSVEEVP